MCRPLMKAGLRGNMPCLPLVAASIGIAAAGANVVYLTQQQNVMAAPQPTSVAPPMGIVMANPAAVQIDQQQNPLIGIEAN
jgi:hypothetical protein